MTSTSEPFEDANEADVAEQATPATAGGSTLTPEDVSPDEASVVDILEQGATVSPDDERTDPHASGDAPA